MIRFPGTCREQDSFYLKLNTQIKTAKCYTLGLIYRSNEWPEYVESTSIVTVTNTVMCYYCQILSFSEQFQGCEASLGMLTSGNSEATKEFYCNNSLLMDNCKYPSNTSINFHIYRKLPF